MKTIDFAIDLGTTNSLIAQFRQGKVEVFRNPIGFKETLPSCVAFRGERIMVGDKAREWVVKDPLNVFSSFKRKMGTGEKYFVPAKMESVSAIDLSAMVLRELKNFIPTPQKPLSMVITIPASFDTVQSNATKQAGYDAGFTEVILLQEPIAASLAFFNNRPEDDKGKWLVYDLGGGTFDAAIIAVENGEMRVVDHQGDNFLGGVDIDHLIVTELLVPRLVKISGNSDLAESITTRSGPYERLYYVLLQKAEECKKELSFHEVADVDFVFELPDGKSLDVFMEINRGEVETIISETVERSMDLVRELFDRNALVKEDIEEVVLIGGSTLIPLVRNRLQEVFGIPLNYNVDPTNAVAAGAAFYAGTRRVRGNENKVEISPEKSENVPEKKLDVAIAYNNSTRDLEEYVTAQIKGANQAAYYRITRQDGGYDSGLKKITGQVGEFVLLRENTVNIFSLRFFDEDQNEIYNNAGAFEITHGLYSLFGQPLPEDICLEVDDLENNTTRCELIFQRNSILPLSKTIYKEISRTIKKGDSDGIIINLLEGDHTTHPNANKIIGVIEIKSGDLQGQVVRGSEVEIKIEISESRDVHVTANILFTNQEFAEVFSPTEKYVSLHKLREEIVQLRQDIENSVMSASDGEDFEAAHALNEDLIKLNSLHQTVMKLKTDDLSDARYQLEEQKRKIARSFYSSKTRNSKVQQEMMEYVNLRSNVSYWVENYEDMPPELKKKFEELVQKEHEVLKSNSYFMIKSQRSALSRVADKMIYQVPTLTIAYYHMYADGDESDYTDYKAAERAIKRGEKALERQNYVELGTVLHDLVALSKSSYSESVIKGTGIG